MSYFKSPVSSANSGVAFTRDEVRLHLGEYALIDDCLAGEAQMKRRGELYLPNPSPKAEKQSIREERYKVYLERATFFNACRNTLNGLLGQIFSKPVTLKFPDELQFVVKSPSGDGVTLEQQSKLLTSYVLSHSRAGLLVDFPDTSERQASKSDVLSGIIRPTITPYKSAEIINWRVEDVGAEEVLTLVVLKETVTIDDSADPFKVVNVTQYRVLRLTDGAVYQEIWRPNDASKRTTEKYAEFVMNGFDGSPLRRIPFRFVGLTSNAIEPEAPAFLDLAVMNLAHYRNSADYEEAAFICGQPMAVVSGLTEDWIKTQFPNGILFGARSGLPLPVGADAKVIQSAPNIMVKEAMLEKERQMRAIGAKLVESEGTVKTATESRIDATSEGGMLSSAAKNVSSAYLWALSLCCDLLGVTYSTVESGGEPTLVFELNSEFDIARMSAQERREVVASWQSGAIAFSDMYKVMQKAGIATLSLEHAKKEIQEENQLDAEFQAETAKALAEANGSNEPPIA